jgi:hypothetical protein
MAYNYPLKPSSDDELHIKTFYSELQFLLPCELCKYTYKQHFNKHPINKYLASRADIIEWVEIMYQETKKVIQDKRIKIMDITEEIEEVRPIKMSYKSKNDYLEEQLNEMRRKIMSKDYSKQAIQVPPAIIPSNNKSIKLSPVITQIPLSQKPYNNLQNLSLQQHSYHPQKRVYDKKTYIMTEQLPIAEKISVGKKSDINDQIKKDSITNINVIIEKPIANKKNNITELIKPKTISPIEKHLNTIPNSISIPSKSTFEVVPKSNVQLEKNITSIPNQINIIPKISNEPKPKKIITEKHITPTLITPSINTEKQPNIKQPIEKKPKETEFIIPEFPIRKPLPNPIMMPTMGSITMIPQAISLTKSTPSVLTDINKQYKNHPPQISPPKITPKIQPPTFSELPKPIQFKDKMFNIPSFNTQNKDGIKTVTRQRFHPPNPLEELVLARRCKKCTH